jgi:hypothetical protein
VIEITIALWDINYGESEVGTFIKNLRKSIITISLSLILISSIFQIIPENEEYFERVSAISLWKQDLQLDFYNGTAENISISSTGDAELSKKIEYIEDDFFDESKISFKNNLTINTTSGEAQLIKKDAPVLENWNLTFGGSQPDDGSQILKTTDGGYLLIGSTMSYGANPGFHDIWLVKIRDNGVKQWSRTIGGIDSEWSASALQTSDGGFVITGMTASYSAGKFDLWLIKIDGSGNELWNHSYGGSSYEQGFSINETSDGGFIITGYTSSFGAGLGDIWLIKTNNMGIEQWNKTLGLSGYEEGHSVIQTSDGGYFITGYTRSFSTGYEEAWLVKTDNFGNEQWNKTFNGASGNSIISTNDNNFIIVGETFSTGPGLYDMWVVKIDEYGNVIWERSYGGSDKDRGNSIIQTADGGYIVVGFTKSYGTGKLDLWLVKINWNGNEEWNKTFGGIEDDWGTSVLHEIDHGFLIIGVTNSYGKGNHDMWLIKTHKSYNLYTEGILLSKNILENQNATSINIFNYTATIPHDTYIKFQFSQDNTNWYSSSGILNDSDDLNNGTNSIVLPSLKYYHSNFYYRAYFYTYKNEIPILQNINLSFNKYYSLGTYVSPIFNSGKGVAWKYLTLSASMDSRTELKIKFRSGISKFDLLSNNFVGPDGESNSFYSIYPSYIWSGHNNHSWFQYKIILSTQNTYVSPTISEIIIEYNHYPEIPKLVYPTNNSLVNNNKISFSWNFNDFDSISQDGYQWQMDNEPDFTSVDLDSGEVSSNETTYLPSEDIADGIWYWRLRSKDPYNDWGLFSNYSILTIDTNPPHSLSIEINNGAPVTYLTEVTLKLNSKDDLSGVNQSSFSFNNITWTDWEPYSNSTVLNLPNIDGEHTIFFRVADKAGNIAEPTSAKISLNTKKQHKDTDNDNYPDDLDAFPNDPTRWEKENGKPPDKNKTNDKKSDDSTWLIVSIAIIIIIIVVILLFFILTKGKKKHETEQKPQSEQKSCKTCGLSLKYYTQNNKYYCHHCNKYE